MFRIILMGILIVTMSATFPKLCTQDEDCGKIDNKQVGCAKPGNSLTDGFCGYIEDGKFVPIFEDAVRNLEFLPNGKLRSLGCESQCGFCSRCVCFMNHCV